MIINKLENYYIIKLPNTNINVYDQEKLEKITEKIIIKINKKNKLNNNIYLEFFINNNYGTIIKLTDYKSPFIINNNKTVKIKIHKDFPFLYQIDYFDIKNDKLKKENIYYYKNKFYLKINSEINLNEYIKILELSEIIYEEALDIIDNGIKI